MAKTNFTKAEEALAETLHKLSVENLLEQTTASSANKKRQQVIKALQRDFKRLHRIDKEIYKKLSIKKNDLEIAVAAVDQLTEEEWKVILGIKEKVDLKIKELAAQDSTDEQIVEKERHTHINKRFNVNDKWLPLK